MQLQCFTAIFFCASCRASFGKGRDSTCLHGCCKHHPHSKQLMDCITSSLKDDDDNGTKLCLGRWTSFRSHKEVETCVKQCELAPPPEPKLEIDEHQVDELQLDELQVDDAPQRFLDESSALVWHKVGAAIVILIAGAIGVALPYVSKNKRFTDCFPYANTFAAGAFLGLSMFHLYSEAIYYLESAGIGIVINDNWWNATWAIGGLGFVVSFFLEDIVVVSCESKVDEAAELKETSGGAETAVDDETDTAGSDDIAKDIGGVEGSQVEIESKPVVGIKSSLFWNCFFLILVLFVHSLFEGIVVGLMSTPATVWIGTISIVCHKVAVGFALAVKFISSNIKLSLSITLLTIFVLATPIGVFLGLLVDSSNNAVAGVFTAWAAGSILHIGFKGLFEEIEGVHKGCKKFGLFCCFLTAYVLLFLFMLLHLKSHEHDDHDDHDDR